MLILKLLVSIFLVHSSVGDGDDDTSFHSSDSSKFSFGQVVDEEAGLPVVNVSQHRKYSYNAPKGQHIGVYDGLIGAATAELLRTYLNMMDSKGWLFNNYDPDDQNIQATPDNVPWVNNRDPLFFAKSVISQKMRSAIRDISGDDSTFYPYRVQGKIIRRGDHTKTATDSNVEGEYSVLVYLNTKWEKNWYGETYFYDESREIMCGVTPKNLRVVVWDAILPRLLRPPAITFSKGQMLFQVVFTKSKEKMMKHHEEHAQWQREKMEAEKTWYLPGYVPKNPETFIPDVAKHLTAELKTKAGRRILIFDNLFPDDLLFHLRKYVLKYGTYFYDDSTDDPTSDNVQWIAGFSMQDYLKSPYWQITKEVARFASGSNTRFPYDVAINLIRNADHTRIHQDCSEGENEWTFLVYLNPDWSHANYGETVYFETNSKYPEIAAEVRPRFGRAVIFEGIIPHSARPPSLNFTGARLSFATKLSIDEPTGRSKNFKQESQHFVTLAGVAEYLDTTGGRQAVHGEYEEQDSGRDAKDQGAEEEEGDDVEEGDGNEEQEEGEDDQETEENPNEDAERDAKKGTSGKYSATEEEMETYVEQPLEAEELTKEFKKIKGDAAKIADLYERMDGKSEVLRDRVRKLVLSRL